MTSGTATGWTPLHCLCQDSGIGLCTKEIINGMLESSTVDMKAFDSMTDTQVIVSVSLVAMAHNAHLVRSHPPLSRPHRPTPLLPHLGVLFAHSYDHSGAHMCIYALNCAYMCTCVHTGAHMWVWLGVGVGAG